MSGAAVAAAWTAMATKAAGTIVRVQSDAFLRILEKQEDALVVHATARLSRNRYHYLTSYKGLAFFTKSRDPLPLPPGVEMVLADKIWIP